MKIGAAIWPFQWDVPYDEPIRRIAAMGFTAIELIVWDEESFAYYTPEKVREIRALLDGEGLYLSQLVHSPRKFASPDAGERRASVESFRRAAELAVELGAPIVNSLGALPFAIATPKITERVHMQTFSVPYPRGLDWRGNWEAYVESIGEATRAASEAGLRHSIEAHPFRWVADTASMLRLIDHVGSPDLGMNFDPSHLFPVGEIPHATIYQLRERIFHCDFSDNDGTSNVHWRPGKGKIDWGAVLDALVDIGYDGVISIELEDVPGVSRGLSAAAPNAVATDEFAAESGAAAAYVARLATDRGYDVDWNGDPAWADRP